MKKQAFTFAELMISLLIISILAAILYPTLAHFRPNNNKPLFKSAYRVLTTTISEIVNSREDGELPLCLGENNTIPTKNSCHNNYSDSSAIALCRVFCEKANTIKDTDDADATCATQCSDNKLTTANGMRWYFRPYTASYTDPMPTGQTITNVFPIWVDVNSSNNTLDSEDFCSSPIDNTDKGEFCYALSTDANTGIYTALPTNASPSGTFSIERLKGTDTFVILVNETGKIISMSPAGWANLEDDENNPD